MKYLVPFSIGVLSAACLAACNGNAGAADTVNEPASLPATPLLQPRAWRALTSSADRRNGTMSVLYGNAAAVASARSGAAYSEGTRLSLVTWKRVPDARWFGAYIPGEVLSVEEVEFPAAAGAHAPVYSQFEGPSVKKITPDPEEAARRTATIVGQRASILP